MRARNDTAGMLPLVFGWLLLQFLLKSPPSLWALPATATIAWHFHRCLFTPRAKTETIIDHERTYEYYVGLDPSG